MYSAVIAYILFGAFLFCSAGSIIWMHFAKTQQWWRTLALLVLMVLLSYVSTNLLLGRARPVLNIPMWSMDMSLKGYVVYGGIIVDQETCYLLVSEGVRGEPKMLYYADARDLIIQLRKAMEQNMKQNGERWGFDFDPGGFTPGDDPGNTNGSASLESRIPEYFRVAPPEQPMPKPETEDTGTVRGTDGNEIRVQ